MESKGAAPFPRSEPQASGEGGGEAALQVAIFGAGVSGLCTAIQLRKAGIESFAVFEKSHAVGGTWHDNTYPGASCDVPSHLYSFSFEPNPDWSRAFSPQPEIQRYLHGCAEKYGVLAKIRFGVEIASAHWDDATARWLLRTTAGEEITARAIVAGLGQLNRPHFPAIPGTDAFAGTSFHSARWIDGFEATGRSIAVVGNGASAIQFVPEIAKTAARVTIYQRSANWIIPRNDRRFGDVERARFRRFPALVRALRWLIWSMLEIRFIAFLRDTWYARRVTRQATAYLDEVVKDPMLRAKLLPDYPIGCKRILISDDYYQALVRPNVEVVTEAIDRVEPHAVHTADGNARPADTIVWATGFETTRFLAPIAIEGRGGRRLDEAWRDGAEAHLGITVPDFPNLFVLYGPNTNLGHNSIIFMIECQVGYVVRCLDRLLRGGVRSLAVRRDVADRFNAELQRKLAKTTWTTGCASWYKNAAGKVVNNWSGFTTEYWWRTRRSDWREFESA
jgi:cation diffusion facilitator CzcD-associated flavoprotein CzcO